MLPVKCSASLPLFPSLHNDQIGKVCETKRVGDLRRNQVNQASPDSEELP